MKVCPKCAQPVDQDGLDWVQIFFDGPGFKWSPVCHTECAAAVIKDMQEVSILPT